MERFWAKVDKGGPGGCWLWTAFCDPDGYGKFAVGSRCVLAHRFAWELLVGPIPEGLTLDHVKARGCEHRHCVNPGHLEPVTNRVNVLRGENANARKTHCKRGHPLDEAYIPKNGSRQCRACQAVRRSAAKAKG